MTDVKNNPANEKAELTLPPGYRPMSVGQRRLEVPPIPGYHLHWFRGSPSNINRALQAGYSFVDPDEVSLNDFDLAGGDENKGTDLGSRVSVISGDDVGHNGQPGRLYLMKCKEELYQYAQGLLAKQVDDTADSLRGGKVGVSQDGQETQTDAGNRYLKQVKAPLLTRKT